MNFLYLLSGIIFGFGLSLSGMIDPKKVEGFLSMGFADWNPALLFVLGSAAPVYAAIFFYVRRRGKTLSGKVFPHPANRPVDIRLVLGSIIFGAGWGLVGVCPGPALVNLPSLSLNFSIFIATMYVGFWAQRRFT
jgi:uncharacterized membrane protein YedE/YeeE